MSRFFYAPNVMPGKLKGDRRCLHRDVFTSAWARHSASCSALAICKRSSDVPRSMCRAARRPEKKAETSVLAPILKGLDHCRRLYSCNREQPDECARDPAKITIHRANTPPRPHVLRPPAALTPTQALLAESHLTMTTELSPTPRCGSDLKSWSPKIPGQ